MTTINATQETIFRTVFDNLQPVEVAAVISPLFTRLRELDESTVSQALGSMGVRLWNFAKQVDFTHPDIRAIAGLLDDNTFTKRLCQAVEGWKHAKEGGLNELLPLFRKMARHSAPPVFNQICSPKEAQRFVRLIPDQETRDKIRATKKPRIVQLRSFYKRGENGWHIQPENFELFAPRSKGYAAQIEAAKVKAERLKKIGCESMCSAVSTSIEEFVKTFEQHNHQGFYRLSATNAAITLAKMHGYTLQTPVRTQDARMIKCPDAFRPFFSQKASSSVDSDEEQLINELRNMVAEVAAKEFGEKGKEIAFQGGGSAPMSLVYAPTLYPLGVFLDAVYGKERPPMPRYRRHDDSESDVYQYVQWLEAYPSMNGKPLFDHYLVMVPSCQPISWEPKPATPNEGQGPAKAELVSEAKAKEIKKKKVEKKPAKAAPAEPQGPFEVVVGDKTESFPTPMEAKMFLDRTLIAQKLVTPILLGEREGQCYFLSFWA